jgi:hypothetical protein
MLNNITQIPAPRVPVIDANTGLMSREWYRFFVNLFDLTGDGSNTTSLTDLQVGPPSLDGFAASITFSDLAPPIPTPTSVDDLAPRDELGTLAAKNSASLTADVSGILPTANGGTGVSTFTANGVAYASSTSVLATGSALVFTSGSLGINGTPAASAILDGQSTTQGFRFPNMTTTQKNAISSPATGLVVFDTTLAKLCVYSGSAWQTVTSV